MITRSITLDCTYKIKVINKNNNFDDICTELKSILTTKIDSEEFDTALCAITKERSINIEKVEDSKIEFIITMFITTMHAPQGPRKLLKTYMENNLINISSDNFTAKIIKRRIY